MFVEIDNINIHYKLEGEGRDVVLLHGWGTSHKTFDFLQNHLKNWFKVYSIDFPGFGDSGEPLEPWGVTEYARFLETFIKKMGIQHPILVGHSFGGRVIIRYAQNHDVYKIILTGSAGIKPKRKPMYYIKVYSYKLVKHSLQLPFLRKYKEQIITKMKNKLGSADYKNISGVMQQTLVKVVNEDLRDDLPNIQAPTLLIWGENDTATPLEDGKLMEKLIPDAGLVVFKNAGHYAFLEQGHQFLIIVDKFLEKDKGE